MKQIFIFLIVISLGNSGFAQNIDFYSQLLELAVKYELGIEEDTPLTREVTDTITTLNLSAYGLEDIRDLVYFPNLQKLDLSYNLLENISALTNMQHLQYLDLSCNRLKSLNDLAFSEASEMIVLTARNYIADYELILNNPNCLFTIIGLNSQKRPYSVIDFYTDFDPNTSQKIINYNVWTYNEYDSLYLSYDGKNVLITGDNQDIQIMNSISDNVIYLNVDKNNIDTIYFVSPTELIIDEETVEIAPALPTDNKVLSVGSLKSETSFSGNSVFFTMAENITHDTIRIGFGKDDYNIKGYTYYYIRSGDPTGMESLTQRDKLIFYPNPVENMLTVNIPNPDAGMVTISLINLAGQIAYKSVTNEAVHNINVQSLEEGVYILHVTIGEKVFIEKVIKR